MKIQKYDYGMIGSGTMGRNLVLNMNDHGYSVAVLLHNDIAKAEALKKEAVDRQVYGTTNLEEFMDLLRNCN